LLLLKQISPPLPPPRRKFASWTVRNDAVFRHF
jgi:hypothetical protein